MNKEACITSASKLMTNTIFNQFWALYKHLEKPLTTEFRGCQRTFRRWEQAPTYIPACQNVLSKSWTLPNKHLTRCVSTLDSWNSSLFTSVSQGHRRPHRAHCCKSHSCERLWVSNNKPITSRRRYIYRWLRKELSQHIKGWIFQSRCCLIFCRHDRVKRRQKQPLIVQR